MSAMRTGVRLCLLILACTLSTRCRKEPVNHPPRSCARPRSALPKTTRVVDSARPGTGTIVGDVVDAKTGEALIGASIWLVGTGRGAASDERGRFRLVNIRPGASRLATSYVGYADTLFAEMVAADCTAHVHIGLKARPVEIRGRY